MTGARSPSEADKATPRLRSAVLDDVPKLLQLESDCFDSDRINRRQFRWMITRANAELRLLEQRDTLLGYVLVLFHKGTSLARLYSLAVSPTCAGRGFGAQLLAEAERLAQLRHCTWLRLEVDPRNTRAVSLYETRGYLRFGLREDYYQDHGDALLYQKRVLQGPPGIHCHIPYYAQTLDFTCGPSCLIMAMRSFCPGMEADRRLELQLWREATTIYMTSGHGGCSPQGLALAADRRGFSTELMLSQTGPLFLDGVRRVDKKEVMALVHEDFMAQIEQRGMAIRLGEFGTTELVTALSSGCVPLVLISSWRFNDNKAPHWVVMVAADEHFVYLHDPDVDTGLSKTPGDTVCVPVRIDDFERMIRVGQSRMQAALCLCPPSPQTPEKP